MGPTSEKYTMDRKKQNNGKHICRYCKAGFSTKPDLIYHLSVCPVGSDKRTKKYACEWCKQEFSSEPLLQYHHNSCHCKVKNKFYEGFKFKFPLASIDIMHEENLVDVDDVEVRNDPNNMDNDPPQDLPILCKWCGRDFMCEEQYKKHHPGCPNKPCPEEESEDEEFVDPVDLMQEEDSEVFRCLWCFGRFGTAAQLKLHRNICPKRRFRDSSFKNKALTDDKSSTHQENVKEPPVSTSESPKRIFTCEWCGRVWKNEVPFLVHPIMCPKKPKVKEAPNEAKKEHPIPRPKTPPGMFKCEWCGRIFEDWHKLQWHRNDCPDNPDKKKGLQKGNHDPIPRPKTPPNTYRCDWCQRVFSSEYHLNWHRQRCPKRPKTPPKKVAEKKISPGAEQSKSKKKNSHKKRKRVDILERRPDIRWLWDDLDDFHSFEEEFFSCQEDEGNRTDLQSQSESVGEATQINKEANIEETRSDSEAYTPVTPSDSLNGKLVGLRPNSSTKTNCAASPIVKRFKCQINGVMLADQVQFGFTILEAHFDFRHANQVDFENPDSSAATDTKIVEIELDYEENGSEGQYTCAESNENQPSVLVTNGHLMLDHSNGYETYECEWCGFYFSSKDHLEWHKKRCRKKPPESVNEDMTKKYDSGQLGTPCRKRKSAGSDVASAKKLRFVDYDEKSAPSCEEPKDDDVEMPDDVLNRSHVEAKANDSPSNQKSGIEPKDPPKEVETPCTEFLVVKCKACNKHFEAPKPKLRLKDFIIRHNKEKHGIQNSFDGFLIKISSILNPIIRDKEVKDDGTQGTAGPTDDELDAEFDYEKIGNHEWYKCKKCDKKYRSVLKITRHHRLTHGSPQGFESDKSKSVLQKFQDFDENVRKHPQTRKGGGGRPKQNRNPKSPKKQKEESIKPQTFSCIPCKTMFYTQHEKDVHLRTAEHRKTLERLAEQGKK